jgi:hypothetical protein
MLLNAQRALHSLTTNRPILQRELQTTQETRPTHRRIIPQPLSLVSSSCGIQHYGHSYKISTRLRKGQKKDQKKTIAFVVASMVEVEVEAHLRPNMAQAMLDNGHLTKVSIVD